MTWRDPLAATFAFGDVELDWRSRELRKRGKRQRVRQRPLRALVPLVSAGCTVHALACDGAALLADTWGTELTTPREMIGAMVASAQPA